MGCYRGRRGREASSPRGSPSVRRHRLRGKSLSCSEGPLRQSVVIIRTPMSSNPDENSWKSSLPGVREDNARRSGPEALHVEELGRHVVDASAAAWPPLPSSKSPAAGNAVSEGLQLVSEAAWAGRAMRGETGTRRTLVVDRGLHCLIVGAGQAERSGQRTRGRMPQVDVQLANAVVHLRQELREPDIARHHRLARPRVTRSPGRRST